MCLRDWPLHWELGELHYYIYRDRSYVLQPGLSKHNTAGRKAPLVDPELSPANLSTALRFPIYGSCSGSLCTPLAGLALTKRRPVVGVRYNSGNSSDVL